MQFPQFAVMIYFAVFAVFEIVALAMVLSRYIDVTKGRYQTRRAFTEAWLFRVASKATLLILIYAGGFWG